MITCRKFENIYNLTFYYYYRSNQSIDYIITTYIQLSYLFMEWFNYWMITTTFILRPSHIIYQFYCFLLIWKYPFVYYRLYRILRFRWNSPVFMKNSIIINKSMIWTCNSPNTVSLFCCINLKDFGDINSKLLKCFSLIWCACGKIRSKIIDAFNF
jgi:hypothetical protein